MIGQEIKGARERSGHTQASLAKALGITRGAVGQWEIGESRPTRDKEAGLVRILGMDWSVFREEAPRARASAPPESLDVDLTRPHTDGLVGGRDLPVYGSAQGGPDGEMILTFEPIETVRRPAPLEGVHGGFGFYMVGESMSPVYEPGDMILCHPTRPPYAGQDVLVIRQHNGSQCALVKRLVRIDDHGLRLRQFTPPDDGLCVPREEVVSFHLVVGKYNRR
jgi:phage repressor protein C with HTH and peptisase S24 domain